MLSFFNSMRDNNVEKSADEIINMLQYRNKGIEEENDRLRKENDLLRHTIHTFENEEIKQRVIDCIKGIDANNLNGRTFIAFDEDNKI